jgi:hypothetical protein
VRTGRGGRLRRLAVDSEARWNWSEEYTERGRSDRRDGTKQEPLAMIFSVWTHSESGGIFPLLDGYGSGIKPHLKLDRSAVQYP